MTRGEGNEQAADRQRLEQGQQAPLEGGWKGEELRPVPHGITIQDGVGCDANEARPIEKAPHALGGAKLEVLDIEDRRLASQDLRGKGSAIVADQEERAPRLEGCPGVAAERERIRKVFDGLEAGDQAQRLWREGISSKDVVANQGADRGLRRLDRSR